MKNYTRQVMAAFQGAGDQEVAEGQAAYLRNKFAFYGVKSPVRRELQKPFLQKENLPEYGLLESVIKAFWEQPERELQHFAMELCECYKRNFKRGDLALLEFMATHKQWWDTIDYIATKLMAAYFKSFPEERIPAVSRWLKGNDFWLQRCGILFQLKYKKDTDTALLESAILPLMHADEFFIQKAIGWALREYRKTNAEWVDDFVNGNPLRPLSRREAWKHK